MAFCEIQLSTGLVISPDTAEALTHAREAEATSHPVEDGSNIADHVIVKPKRFSLTTVWTPRPWDDLFQPTGPNRPQQAFTILAQACQDKTSIWVQLDDIDYRPVIIESCTMQRQFADGDSRTIQLECKEITIAQGKTVTTKIASSLKPKGPKKVKKITPQTYSWQDYRPGFAEWSVDRLTAPAAGTTVAVPFDPDPPANYIARKKATTNPATSVTVNQLLMP